MILRRLFNASILFMLIASCSDREAGAGRSFYYWKTTYAITEKQQQLLEELNVTTLYLRLFDIDKDPVRKRIFPLARIRYKTRPSAILTYIPVVYITNRTLIDASQTDVSSLADSIYKEVVLLSEKGGFSFTEMQLDCDWSSTTKENYFMLSGLIKKRLNEEQKTLSVTIRLHQVKYPGNTGIPPCDRGMLMFYNMGKLGNDNRNSIFNPEDAGKYTSAISHYPLELDIALPVFSWSIQTRDHKTISLLNHTNPDSMFLDGKLQKEDASTWIATDGFYYNGAYIRKNDRLKFEHAGPEVCLEAAGLVKKELGKKKRNIVLFDFDEVNLSYYEKEELEAVFDSFH